MKFDGCFKMILFFAFMFGVFYFAQSTCSKNTRTSYQENFASLDNSGKYDVQSNQQLETSNHMPGNYISSHQNTGSSNYPNAPTCPQSSSHDNTSFPQNDDYAASCFPKSQLTPDDLLPSNECNVWSKSNPYGSDSLGDKNFLQAGWATGIGAVGSVMRNANLQLRSEPPNPQVSVSPWQQSTIQPDLERKPLEVGGCA